MYNKKKCREKQGKSQHTSQCPLPYYPADFLYICFKIRNKILDDIIDYYKYYLPDKEIIITDGIYKESKYKGTSLVFFHKIVKGDKKQRKEHNHVMEMVKKKILIHESGEGIKHGAYESRSLILHIS